MTKTVSALNGRGETIFFRRNFYRSFSLTLYIFKVRANIIFFLLRSQLY